MSSGLDMGSLGLYLLRQVCLTFEDGQNVIGQLTGLSENGIHIDATVYPLDQVKDIEMVGEITDYHTYQGTGVIADFEFAADEIAAGFDPKMITYGEFDCTAACHLQLESGKIYAKDVRLLSASHRIYEPELAEKPYLYRLKDGTCIAARLKTVEGGYGLETAEEEYISIDMKDVADITKVPEGNDYILVRLKDGTQIRGIVSAATDDMMVVFNGEQESRIVRYEDMESLRYRGSVVVGTITVAKGTVRQVKIRVNEEKGSTAFLCKKPYCVNPEQLEAFVDGDLVSFVPGITDRGMIAKDVELVEKEDIDRAEPAAFRGMGAVLFFPSQSGGCGYIGSEYRSRTYCKMKECESVRGNVSFTEDQIDFSHDRGYIYVVSYTCAGDPSENVQKAVTVRLEKKFPYADYAKVWIDEKDEIKTLPASVLYLPFFKAKDVELSLKNGTRITGYLAECDETRAEVIPQDAADEKVIVDLKEIEKARYMGVITGYRTDNGMGFIGNYWFHINSLRDMNDMIHVSVNRRVLFSIEQTFKGKMCAATDITVCMEERKKGFLRDYDGVHCRVVAEEDFGDRGKENVYQITALRESIADKLGSLHCDAYDYPVVYTLRKSGLDTYIVLTHVDVSGAVPKRYTGYVLTFIDKPGDTGFGFILPPEELEEHLQRADKTGKTYFKESDIVKPCPFKLNTQKKYYRVKYTRVNDKTAREVEFLEAYDFPRPVPAQAASPAPVGPQVKSETIDLAEFTGKNDAVYEGSDYKFGLVGICSSHYGFINSSYINRKFSQDSEYDVSQSVIFNPENVKILDGASMKTNKHVYLVRYVAEGTVVNVKTGAEHLAINYRYPIEVLKVFPKKQCRSLKVEDGTLIVEAASRETEAALSKEHDQDIPPYHRGESLLIQMLDSSVEYAVYSDMSDDFYIVNGNKKIPKDAVARIYRFGVVTGFNMNSGVARINKMTDFDLTVGEPKLINILKNQINFVRLHVIYTHSDGKITSVCRIPEEYCKTLRWESGIVTECDSVERKVLIGGETRHYLSVLTDGLVNRQFKNGTLSDSPVYIKKVYHLFRDEESAEPSLESFAVDIRCEVESAAVRYDAGRDIYMGYRNETHFYPIFGSKSLLSRYDNRTTEIRFIPSADGYDLEARLGDDDFSEDTEENLEELVSDNETLEGVCAERLSEFCMQQVDLRGMPLKGVRLDEQGMPVDKEQAQRAFDILWGQPGDNSSIAASRVALEFPEIELSKGHEEDRTDRKIRIGKMLLNAFKKRCRKLGQDANLVYGEHVYYLSLLLRYPVKGDKRSPDFTANDCLYRLFLQDFGTREELSNYVQKWHNTDKRRLEALLRNNCHDIRELIAHVVILDKKSSEIVCRLLESNYSLADDIQHFALQIDDTIRGEGLQQIIRALRERYGRDKLRFAEQFSALSSEKKISSDVKDLIIHMQSRFLKMVCESDADRFEILLRACRRICDYTNEPGFSRQEQMLKTAYRDICALEKEILQHPCRESVEILMINKGYTAEHSVLTKLKEEITLLLNQLYQDPKAAPQIMCTPNEEVIEEGQDRIWLIVRNGTSEMNLQPADNVTLLFESYTEGISVPGKVSIKQNHLAPGEQVEVEIALVEDRTDKSVINIGWSAEYEYTAAFENGESVKKSFKQDKDEYFELQTGVFGGRVKDIHAENPYEEPARGQPLEDSDMFFGRQEESQAIRNSIIREVDGTEEFIPGSAVIIHGQKKSGKTSLVYQIKNYIKENEALRRKAIILNFNNILDEIGGVGILSGFKFTFYGSILSRFEDEVYENHPEVEEMMEANGLEVPDVLNSNKEAAAILFDKFFRNFFRCDNGQHVLLLFMDEFTLLCTAILSEIRRDPANESLNKIPNFIKTFSQYGFIQIIIGHEAMMRAFDTLGVLNHTAEFAKSVEIAALDQKAAEELVKKPMEKAFGFDVYNTALGKRAVEKLLDLSGCNPTYLMRLCNRMFEYYTDPKKCSRSQIYASDVDAMTREFIGDLLLMDFDILLVEDGDETEEPEKRKTYQYLRCAAFCSVYSFDGRTADSSEISRELKENYGYDDYVIESVRNLLERRRVISITQGGRVKINVGLFPEFILQKNGGK